MMADPLLYEINTRCWLTELSRQAGECVTLDTVPDAELEHWRRLGFTHVWLMGVWKTGPRSRVVAAAMLDLQQQCDEHFGCGNRAAIVGSPYAIADYRVAKEFGGEDGLRAFRERLNRRGLKLILDFVPNHVGLDHPWLSSHPEYFVQSSSEVPGAFLQKTAIGQCWLAHGRDPYFPPWEDTAQLDYRRSDTRAVMRETLQSVADRCDGVRCDMAMLVLSDVFARTWEAFPTSAARTGHLNSDCDAQSSATGSGAPAATANDEFWPEAIAFTKGVHPDFIFLGEVYWGLESRLRAQGFDFLYDKELLDLLVNRDAAAVQRHLLEAPSGTVQSSAHFLENHDEKRIASQLNAEEHRAAALLILSLPGMRFLHDGQLDGARIHTPVQFARRCPESFQPEIREMYERLLRVLPQTAVGRGKAALPVPREAWPGNPTAGNFVVVQWQLSPREFDLAAINLAPHRSQCYVPLEIEDLAKSDWTMKDRLGTEAYWRNGPALQSEGVYFDLPEYGAQLFQFRRVE